MNFLHLKTGARLGLGYGLLLVLLIAEALSGAVGMSRINDSLLRIVEVNVTKMEVLAEMSSAVHVISRVTRNMILESDTTKVNLELNKIEGARVQYNKAAEAFEALPFTEAGKLLIAKIKEYRAEAGAANEKVIALAIAQKDEEARQELLQFTDPVVRKWHNAIEEFALRQKVNNKKDVDDAEKSYSDALTFMVLLAAASVLAGGLMSWYLTRSLLRQLGGEPKDVVAMMAQVARGDLTTAIHHHKKDNTSLVFAMKMMRDSLAGIVSEVRGTTMSIVDASQRIASGNLDLSVRTEEQASTLEETAASMEELTSTVRQNSDNARQANQLALSASDVAIKGGLVVSDVVVTMSSINESARKITDIISVIDGIAFQTNILALNAAVEAARAGEQGRGFAVVASEVRSLAQRSAQAAKEIKMLIGDSLEKVDAGSKLVASAGMTMSDVVASVKRVSDIINDIMAASHEQYLGIEQVSLAIIEMDKVTQLNATLVEQAASTATSLEDQVASLSHVVSVFKIP